jgi:hypothetical protein
MKDSNRQPPVEAFRLRRHALDELVALSRHAGQALRSRSVASFARLSELLDELLPVEPEREARIANAIAVEVGELRRLRAGTLDPLRASPRALAELLDALRIDRASLRRLIASDHAAFAPAVARRGTSAESDDFAGLEAALDRIALDDPERMQG